MRVSLIKANEPDVNGRVWPEEVLVRAAEQMNEKEFAIQFDYSEDACVHLTDMVGFTIPGTGEVKDGQLFSDVKFIDNENGSLAQELIESKTCSMGGSWRIGRVNEENKIQVAELIHIAVIIMAPGDKIVEEK